MKKAYLNSSGNSFFSNTKSREYILQVIGWIIAANLFIVMKAWGIQDATGFLVFKGNLIAVHIEASIMGLAMGLILAYLDQVRLRFFGKKKGFGVVIAIKAVSYLLTIILIITIIAFIFLIILGANIDDALMRIFSFITSTYFLTIVIYSSLVSFLMSFIKQVDAKFGQGNLFNMLIGKYHRPLIEDHIFLFIDLKNATGCAEKLGHIYYSMMLQDCFYDITSVLKKYNAEVYQYVGDEIVLTWKSKKGLHKNYCLHLYFDFIRTINKRSAYYTTRYGLVPEFKAGMNCGHITVAEVGIIKREIAYHGDVINTAARIQAQCNHYGRQFLISGSAKKRLEDTGDWSIEYVDTAVLKGKDEAVELYAVDRK